MGNAAAKLHGGRLFKNMGKVLKWGKQAVCSLVWSLLCLGQPQRDLCEQDSPCVPLVSPSVPSGALRVFIPRGISQGCSFLFSMSRDDSARVIPRYLQLLPECCGNDGAP